jgi:hypothetical protein
VFTLRIHAASVQIFKTEAWAKRRAAPAEPDGSQAAAEGARAAINLVA